MGMTHHPRKLREKPIDWDTAAKLAAMMCNQSEIAAFFNVAVSHLHDMCKKDHKMILGDWLKQHAARGSMSIKRAQFKKAIKEGNTQMLIWLGRVYCNQNDDVINLPKPQDDSINIIDMSSGSPELVDMRPKDEPKV